MSSGTHRNRVYLSKKSSYHQELVSHLMLEHAGKLDISVKIKLQHPSQVPLVLLQSDLFTSTFFLSSRVVNLPCTLRVMNIPQLESADLRKGPSTQNKIIIINK